MKWEIIKKFSAENKRCFSYQDVITEYPDKDHSYLSKVLAAMVRSGMLMKLSRGVYHIIPLSSDPQTYAPDARLVAKYMMKGKHYYLAYSSAMNILGLTHQTGFKTMVVTNRQVQPPIMEWTSDHERMLEESGSSFSLLDPSGPDRGIKNSRFGLKINREVNTLMVCLKS